MAAPAAYRSDTPPAPETGANAPFTADEFLRLKEEGFFGTRRVEFLRGLVVFKMPTSNLHTKALALVLQAFSVFTAPGRFVASQGTVKLGPYDAPEPDALIVQGDVKNFEEEITPDRILLALEVSVSSLRIDRTTKAQVYAEAGLPEFWIVNPAGRQLEVRRNPENGEYREIIVLDETQVIAPLFSPETTISVSSLLGSKPSAGAQD